MPPSARLSLTCFSLVMKRSPFESGRRLLPITSWSSEREPLQGVGVASKRISCGTARAVLFLSPLSRERCANVELEEPVLSRSSAAAGGSCAMGRQGAAATRLRLGSQGRASSVRSPRRGRLSDPRPLWAADPAGDALRPRSRTQLHGYLGVSHSSYNRTTGARNAAAVTNLARRPIDHLAAVRSWSRVWYEPVQDDVQVLG
jgi:hypothetical protein